jgi:DNA repair protein RadC
VHSNSIETARRERADRPRLRRRASGADVRDLDTAELVALVAGKLPDVSVCASVLAELAHCGADELGEHMDLPRARALRLSAALQLARRLHSAQRPERPTIRTPAEVHALLGPELRLESREHFYALLLDGKHRLKARELVSIGSLTTSIVHPREVFRPAIRAAAAAIICSHNHPSGDPEPSAEDVAVTRRLAQAAGILGIPLLDHVVLGDGRYVSLRERMDW